MRDQHSVDAPERLAAESPVAAEDEEQPVAKQRVGEQPLLAELDQKRGVAREGERD
jgi:hypothetical protein